MDNGGELNSNISKRSSLVQELKDKHYRQAFVEAHAKDTVAFQLRRMREAEGWTQGELAKKAFGDPKLQSMVSRFENPDYGKYSVSTLLNLANVFDVGLVVRFAPISELVDWDLNKTGPTLEPPPFAEDKALQKTETCTVPLLEDRPPVNVAILIMNAPQAGYILCCTTNRQINWNSTPAVRERVAVTHG
jgi:transcriptional regulator with XRE-family HTH domain